MKRSIKLMLALALGAGLGSSSLEARRRHHHGHHRGYYGHRGSGAYIAPLVIGAGLAAAASSQPRDPYYYERKQDARVRSIERQIERNERQIENYRRQMDTATTQSQKNRYRRQIDRLAERNRLLNDKL